MLFQLLTKSTHVSNSFHRFYSTRNRLKTLYGMNNAYFRHTPNDGQLQINFRYQNPEFNIDRDFNFCRSVNETVNVCLERIRNNVEKEFNKKLKKKKKGKTIEEEPKKEGVQPPEISIQLLKGSDTLSDITFAEIIQQIAQYEDITLRVVDQHFPIAYNTPWVLGLSLPTSILAKFVVYPNKLDIQFGDKEHSKGFWYKGKMPASKDAQHIKWEKCAEGLSYEVAVDDIGHHLKFELTPGNGTTSGPPVEVVSKNEVQAGPGRCPFEDRLEFTKTKLSGNSFRVISYNLLADLYADSDYSREVLFPYCPPYALNVDYRKQLYMKEIIGYNADIMCLQEVDAKVFDFDLFPTLSEFFNYGGHLDQKGHCAEGLATFYRTDRFELIDKHGVNLGKHIPDLKIFHDLYERIKSNEKLVERICNRTTTLQVTVLRSKDTGHVLIIGNTHLYFHPDADHIRLLQIGFSMLYLQNVLENTKRDLGIDDSRVSIMFCGDFNSTPDCGIYKLLTKNFVEDDFPDWKSNAEEAVSGVTLSQPFSMSSACGCPELTHATHAFCGCLDYIFYQTDNIHVEEVIPLPSTEEIRANTAIPSVVFPSDHIALVADLKFIVR